jgi:hypothetical protein
LLLPNLFDLANISLDLGLLLSPVDQLVDLFSEFVELELDEIIKTELRRGEVNLLLSDSHKLLPVTVLHEL